MSFSFGRPSCELALRCVWAPNLRTCLALRWGAQLANVWTCLAFALERPTCGRALRLRCGRALGRPTCGRALRLRCACALGCPTCGRALCCVGVPNLGEAVLKSLPPSQNLFLSILQLVF